MKKGALIAVLLCAAVGLTACGLNGATPEQLYDTVENVTGWLGSSQLTADGDLIGRRVRGGDAYSGAYSAAPAGVTGRDVLFGGGSVSSRVVKLEAALQTVTGTAVVRVRMNDEVVYLSPDPQGKIETELRFASGGNYVMVDYADFTGTVEMHCQTQEKEDPE